MSTEMDDTLRSSLLNSLFRIQSKHNIIVHHARSRDAFIKSLRMVANKFEKDPYHLVPTPTDATITNMNQHRKSSQSVENYWQDCLSLIPGVTQQSAQKIKTLFPTMSSMIEALRNDRETTIQNISQLKISEKRKMGEKLTQKIITHILSS
jgi:ERCC4-type nuclease